MKTVELVLLTIAAVVFLLLAGNVQISLKSFSFNLPSWNKMLGVIMMVVGFMIYNMGEYTRGYFDGFEKSKKETIETINKMIKDKKYSEKDRDK